MALRPDRRCPRRPVTVRFDQGMTGRWTYIGTLCVCGCVAAHAHAHDGGWLGGVREYIPDAGPVPSNRFL